jgi:hypothetical protein
MYITNLYEYVLYRAVRSSWKGATDIETYVKFAFSGYSLYQLNIGIR